MYAHQQKNWEEQADRCQTGWEAFEDATTFAACTTQQEHIGNRKLLKIAYRKGHLCNSAEEHLQQAEEEETGVELTLCYAVGVEVGPQEQGGRNDCHYGRLERHVFRV